MVLKSVKKSLKIYFSTFKIEPKIGSLNRILILDFNSRNDKRPQLVWNLFFYKIWKKAIDLVWRLVLRGQTGPQLIQRITVDILFLQILHCSLSVIWLIHKVWSKTCRNILMKQCFQFAKKSTSKFMKIKKSKYAISRKEN